MNDLGIVICDQWVESFVARILFLSLSPLQIDN